MNLFKEPVFRTLFAAILPLSGIGVAGEHEQNCLDGKKRCRVTIRHIESGGIGYDNGYTTLETFLASDPSQWQVTPFIDARGHVFDDGKWAANAGIGLRAVWGSRVYGINAYYDFRNTGRFDSNQIGAGLETLGKRVDFRMNGYLPVGVKISNPYDPTFATFSGHYLLVSEKIQNAMKGANAELGFHFGGSEQFDFYTAAGPYYFIGEATPATWGGKARISGTFKEVLTLEISNSYDRTFHNKFQGQLSLNFLLGPKSKVKQEGRSCAVAHVLNDRMLRPVDRQEIIVVDRTKKQTVAINPATGLPYFFVFVDNTGSSDGTYESPYHSLTQAENNSSPHDIIYVFPGDGTSAGMNIGISLKPDQKFWGSGVSHALQTAQGAISIPQQSSISPTITNTDMATAGNAITLSTRNSISGFTITSALNDAIYGTDPQTLEVSSCTFTNISTYPIETVFSGNASVSLTDNQFLNNVNGVLFTFNGTSVLNCSNNRFVGQTSVSSVPLEMIASGSTLTTLVDNNLFNGNTTGSIRISLNSVADANISLLNNTITNNGTGAQASLGSSCVILTSGTVDNCSIVLGDNTFSDNTSNALYLHTSGTFTALEVLASSNAVSDHGGSALVLATPVDSLTLLATDNTITRCEDNGISIISSGSTATGSITINRNTITDIGNASNGIAINQNFSTLDLTILDNEINGCEGTGIISYAPTGIGTLTMDISRNTISNCENFSSNAASGLDIEQYTSLVGSISNNTLSANAGTAVLVGSTLSAPTACLTLTGNSNSANYLLTNPGDGVFNLSPCNVNSVNIGMIDTSGTINSVRSCTDATPCTP